MCALTLTHTHTHTHTGTHKSHFGQVGVAFLAAFLFFCGILFVAAGYKFVAAVAGFSHLGSRLSSRHCHRLATNSSLSASPCAPKAI